MSHFKESDDSTDDIINQVLGFSTPHFDSFANPHYTNVWEKEDSTQVIFNSTVEPAQIKSSNSAVATAEITDHDEGGLLGTDYTVRITGHHPGTAIFTPVAKAGRFPNFTQLEVDAFSERKVFFNFHFVTDAQGNKTARNLASVTGDVMVKVSAIYIPPNIDITVHSSRDVTLNLDFATPNQSRAQQTHIFQTLNQSAHQFDPAAGHINVFFVQTWGARDSVGQPNRQDTNVLASTLVHTIVFEDAIADAGQALAHELGHALGLPHNPHQDALMFENDDFKGTRFFKNEFRRIAVRR